MLVDCEIYLAQDYGPKVGLLRLGLIETLLVCWPELVHFPSVQGFEVSREAFPVGDAI